MRNAIPIRAVAVAVVAVFGFHMSRFYMVFDVMPLICPHHVQTIAMEMDALETEGVPMGAMQHGSHTMPESKQSHRRPQPGSDNSGMRCCCRHTLDGVITTLVLYGPADMANVPVPDGFLRASLASDPSLLQNDLNPPFIPPRV